MRYWRRYVAVATASFIVGGLVVFYIWQSVGGGVWRGGVYIREAYLLSSDTLELSVGSCNGYPRVYQLHQDEESIRLRVEANSTPLKGGNDCADHVNVYLRDPLGDRVVIDDHTGRVVPIVSR